MILQALAHVDPIRDFFLLYEQRFNDGELTLMKHPSELG